MQLLQSKGVMLTPGSAMDMEGWMRIGYARFLDRQGLLEPDAEHSHVALDSVDEDPNVCAATSPDRLYRRNACH